MAMPSGKVRTIRRALFIVAAAFVAVLAVDPALFPAVVAHPGTQASLLPLPKLSPPPPKETRPDRDPVLAKGKFLVARGTVANLRFRETVILLIGHDSAGTTGLIINLPTKVPLADMLTFVPGLKQRSDIVYYGGPVENERLFMLIRSDKKPEESDNLFLDVYVSMSRKTLEHMIDAHKTEKELRMYSGYAGWAPGQLAREVSRGDWYVVDGDAGIIFEKNSAEIWRELFLQSSAVEVWKHDRNMLIDSREKQNTVSMTTQH